MDKKKLSIPELISGCVFMLMVAKVPHFGGITVMGTVMGLFLFVSGHFAVSLVIEVGCSLLADFLARFGKYKSTPKLLISYIVFSFGLTGPVLPLWLMKDAYIASLEAKGKDAAYIDGVFSHINNTTLVVCILATLVAALVGGLFGKKMMKKHFEKAGMKEKAGPFSYLISMEPMPERSQKDQGGLISHVHFQYASQMEKLVNSKGKLKHRHWYATMCDGDADEKQRCNIVRAMHGLPLL